ncbi:MAG: hypothetical protein Q7Q73_09285 [Verrucomicrobiota bacterium JB024]|nr:hypothetical protein [Verrucomicrobiota bacterium JB024]
MSNLKRVIDAAGGPTKASRKCGISVRAIYKWINAESLPRTEYTGETCYAEALADASDGRFTADEIRKICRPGAQDGVAA